MQKNIITLSSKTFAATGLVAVILCFGTPIAIGIIGIAGLKFSFGWNSWLVMGIAIFAALSVWGASTFVKRNDLATSNMKANQSGIPIACNPNVFSQKEREQHIELAKNVIMDWPIRRSETSDGFSLSYEGDETLFLSLAQFASADHQCCPWVHYSLEMLPFAEGTKGSMQLQMKASQDGKMFLKACFEALAGLSKDRLVSDFIKKDEIITRQTLLQQISKCVEC